MKTQKVYLFSERKPRGNRQGEAKGFYEKRPRVQKRVEDITADDLVLRIENQKLNDQFSPPILTALISGTGSTVLQVNEKTVPSCGALTSGMERTAFRNQMGAQMRSLVDGTH